MEDRIRTEWVFRLQSSVFLSPLCFPVYLITQIWSLAPTLRRSVYGGNCSYLRGSVRWQAGCPPAAWRCRHFLWIAPHGICRRSPSPRSPRWLCRQFPRWRSRRPFPVPAHKGEHYERNVATGRKGRSLSLNILIRNILTLLFDSHSNLLNNWSNCPKDYMYFGRANIYGLPRALPVLHQSPLVEGSDAEIAQKSGSMDKCHEGLVHSAGITTSVHCNCPTHRTSCTCAGNVLVVPLLKPSVSRLSEVWNACPSLPSWFILLSTIVGGYHK